MLPGPDENECMATILKDISKNVALSSRIVSNFFRAAFNFDRGVHFALRRQMLKPRIDCLPAI